MIGSCASIESKNYRARLKAVDKTTDQDLLFDVALNDKEWLVQRKAISKLEPSFMTDPVTETKEQIMIRVRIDFINNQNDLIQLCMATNDWETRKLSFRKLNSNSLERIVDESDNHALIMAARIRLEQINWSQVFIANKLSLNFLATIVSAVALVEKPEPSIFDGRNLCKDFIDQIDEETNEIITCTSELIELLERFGDKALAEKYYKCNNFELRYAAKNWLFHNYLKGKFGSASQSTRSSVAPIYGR
jgi:hypothetical protein